MCKILQLKEFIFKIHQLITAFKMWWRINHSQATYKIMLKIKMDTLIKEQAMILLQGMAEKGLCLNYNVTSNECIAGISC